MNKVILGRAAAKFGLGCSFWLVTSGEVVLVGSQWGSRSHVGLGVAALRARDAVDGSTDEKEKVLLNLYVEDYIQQQLGSVTPNYNLNGWIPAGPSWNITAINKSRRSWRRKQGNKRIPDRNNRSNSEEEISNVLGAISMMFLGLEAAVATTGNRNPLVPGREVSRTKRVQYSGLKSNEIHVQLVVSNGTTASCSRH